MDSATLQIKKLLSRTSQMQLRHKEWLFDGRWLKAGCIHYTSPAGDERTWETMERTTTVPTLGVDGTDVIALSKDLCSIHLVAVYRPSVSSVSIEIPGGLVDKGETIEEAALRELGEETGQSGSVESVDFVTHTDPWKSNECSVPCVVKTDGSKKCDPSLKPDDDEYLETFELPLKDLLLHLNNLKRNFGSSIVIESKLYMFAKGLQLGCCELKSSD